MSKSASHRQVKYPRKEDAKEFPKLESNTARTYAQTTRDIDGSDGPDRSSSNISK